MTRVRLATLATLVLSLTILLPSAGTGAAPTLAARVVQDGLTNPWDVAFAPNGQMFVTERPGRVRVYASGSPNARSAGHHDHCQRARRGRGGRDGHRHRPALQHQSVHLRLRLAHVRRPVAQPGDPLSRDERLEAASSTATSSRRACAANTIHNGCAVQVGPDQKLWVTMGDAAHGDWAQDPERLQRQGAAHQPQRQRARRQPDLAGPQRSDHRLLDRPSQPAGDHLPARHRPRLRRGARPRPRRRGQLDPRRAQLWLAVRHRQQPSDRAACGGTFTRPAWSSEGPTLATSGCAFVNGASWGSWNGNLFVSTLKESDLRRFTVNPGELAADACGTRSSTTAGGGCARRCMAPGGRLFLTTSNGTNDKVIRITPELTAPGVTAPAGRRLPA